MHDNIKGGALTEVTFLVLLALKEPNHGYGVMQFIAHRTNNRVKLGAGSLYGAINTLVDKKMIIHCGGDQRKKEYVVTEYGLSIIQQEYDRIIQLKNIAEDIMADDKNEH